jgi:hypothetical protein
MKIRKGALTESVRLDSVSQRDPLKLTVVKLWNQMKLAGEGVAANILLSL